MSTFDWILKNVHNSQIQFFDLGKSYINLATIEKQMDMKLSIIIEPPFLLFVPFPVAFIELVEYSKSTCHHNTVIISYV